MSQTLILVLAAIGLVLLNVGYLHRAGHAGLFMLVLGILCMITVIGGGIYVALQGQV